MNKTIEDYLVPGKRIHLIGIGGVSMRPLGLVLRGMGIEITGSDMNSSVSTDDLIAHGIKVYIGHNAKHVDGVDCIIRTAAAHNDNPEIAAARAKGIPVYERAQAWGVIMRGYKNAICISGTHGKTTTASMITHVFMEAQRDPTVMIGGTLPLLHAGHRVGHGDTIIMESCEYCNSFLNFFPTVAIINNIEEDHLDFFKDLADIQASFRKFAQLVPPGGFILANGDDKNTLKALEGLSYRTFGLSEETDYRCKNLSADEQHFDVYYHDQFYCHIDLHVYGHHNVYNAMATAAAAHVMDVDGQSVQRGLDSFSGAARRLEYKGSCNGADIYDDYAHHPGELHALIQAVSCMGYHRVVLAFQPHTYTRTKALFWDFVRELKTVDQVVLAEIYAARESNTVGVSSKDLAEQIPGAVYFETLPEVSDYLRATARPGDVILTVGAGDIYKAGENLIHQ